MIVCKECGEHQDDGTVFCGRCGSFLEFEGERVEPAAPAANTAVALAQAPDLDADVPANSDGSLPHPDDDATGDDATGEEPDAQPVATRQPEEVRARRRGPAPRHINTLPSGSLVCGRCGAGNAPERGFCQRCGQPLAAADVVTRPPLWRRLLFRERTYAAGTRKRARKRRLPVFRLVLLVAVVVVVILLVGPFRSSVVGAYHSVAGMVAGPEQVRPTSVTASASAPGHAAGLATDGASNTYWAAPTGAKAPALNLGLAGPVDLKVVGITPGTSLKTPVFLKGPRARVVEISATTEEGPKVRRFTLKADPGFQKLKVDMPGITKLTIAVVSAQGAHAGQAAAIAEVELFAAR